jgi:ketosteroid isomerase-like protein
VNEDEQQVTALIHRWAAAVRDIHAYRAAWPDFFAWQRSGAWFEIASLEVTAGVDVALASALLQWGMPTEAGRGPEPRLRLTVGLRTEEGRWVVAHEHHSFPGTSAG